MGIADCGLRVADLSDVSWELVTSPGARSYRYEVRQLDSGEVALRTPWRRTLESARAAAMEAIAVWMTGHVCACLSGLSTAACLTDMRQPVSVTVHLGDRAMGLVGNARSVAWYLKKFLSHKDHKGCEGKKKPLHP